jgi:hypothetical protein
MLLFYIPQNITLRKTIFFTLYNDIMSLGPTLSGASVTAFLVRKAAMLVTLTAAT